MKRRPSRFTRAERDALRHMALSGVRQRDIVRATGRTQSAVSRLVRVPVSSEAVR